MADDRTSDGGPESLDPLAEARDRLESANRLLQQAGHARDRYDLDVVAPALVLIASAIIWMLVATGANGGAGARGLDGGQPPGTR